LVDDELDKKIAATTDAAQKAELQRLKGKVAIANAKLAYQLYKRIYADERWQRLAQQGAQTQRLLWASTGTKNKAYSDVLYVDELIGMDTVNTMPPATMDAYRNHGHPRPSLDEDVDSAQAVMDALAKLGDRQTFRTDSDDITDQFFDMQAHLKTNEVEEEGLADVAAEEDAWCAGAAGCEACAEGFMDEGGGGGFATSTSNAASITSLIVETKIS